MLELENLLFELCENYVRILNESKEQLLISESECNIHSKQKKDFIRYCIDKGNLE